MQCAITLERGSVLPVPHQLLRAVDVGGRAEGSLLVLNNTKKTTCRAPTTESIPDRGEPRKHVTSCPFRVAACCPAKASITLPQI